MKVYYVECLVTTTDGEQFPIVKKVLANTPQMAKHNAKVALTAKGYKTVVKDMKASVSVR